MEYKYVKVGIILLVVFHILSFATWGAKAVVEEKVITGKFRNNLIEFVDSCEPENAHGAPITIEYDGRVMKATCLY